MKKQIAEALRKEMAVRNLNDTDVYDNAIKSGERTNRETIRRILKGSEEFGYNVDNLLNVMKAIGVESITLNLNGCTVTINGNQTKLGTNDTTTNRIRKNRVCKLGKR